MDINEEAPSNIGALRCPVVPNKKYVQPALYKAGVVNF